MRSTDVLSMETNNAAAHEPIEPGLGSQSPFRLGRGTLQERAGLTESGSSKEPPWPSPVKIGGYRRSRWPKCGPVVLEVAH